MHDPGVGEGAGEDGSFPPQRGSRAVGRSLSDCKYLHSPLLLSHFSQILFPLLTARGLVLPVKSLHLHTPCCVPGRRRGIMQEAVLGMETVPET